MQVGEDSESDNVRDTDVHAVLQILRITFAGNHPVERDTLGNFVAPEWQRGRRRQWPLCYTRNTKVRLRATFRVIISPTATETVAVRGRATVGAATLEWSGDVTVSPSDDEVTTAELESSANLPNHVAYFRRVAINWEAQPPGEGWGGAGTSNHLFYLTLGDPQGTPPYWTLLHISCQAAHGVTAPGDLVARTFDPFPSLRLTRRRDSRGLTYWNPRTTRATNTRRLLASGNGSGQCGAWAEFLIDMYKVHGVMSGRKVLICRSLADLRGHGVGFLVKNWRFIGAGSWPPPFTHSLRSECVELNGIPGQRSPNPPPAFYNHFIVECFATFYDPSYGGGPTANQSDWENGAIDGLYRGSRAGYPKQNYASTNLLQFL